MLQNKFLPVSPPGFSTQLIQPRDLSVAKDLSYSGDQFFPPLKKMIFPGLISVPMAIRLKEVTDLALLSKIKPLFSRKH